MNEKRGAIDTIYQIFSVGLKIKSAMTHQAIIGNKKNLFFIDTLRMKKCCNHRCEMY